MSAKRTGEAKDTGFGDDVGDDVEGYDSQVSAPSGSEDSGNEGDETLRRINAPSELGESRQGDQRGRTTNVDRARPRGPAIPSPSLAWGPGRGRETSRSQSVVSRGQAGRDAPSGSKKRQHEGSQDHDRGSKSVKLFDPADMRLYSSMWTSGGLQMQKGGPDTVTGVNRLGGGREKSNYAGQFVGLASDAIATKTTSRTRDAAACLMGAYSQAVDRSKSGEALSVFMPIHRTADPTAETSGGRDAEAPQLGPRKLPLHLLKNKKPKRNQGPVLPNPWMPRRNEADRVATPKKTEAAKDKETEEVAEPTKVQKPKPTEAAPVDLTGLEDATTCDICRKNGSHTTGRCAEVTSLAHGDTNTDPFCNISASHTRSGPGEHVHALQGQQKGKLKIGCPVMREHYANYELEVVWTKLVLERRRQPPLAVNTEAFCFVEMTLRVSEALYNNEMPPPMEGIWPYTKADAVKYQKECKQFWDVGMAGMPRGELEGFTFEEIRRAYKAGKIMPQVRWTAADNKQAALRPADVRRGGDDPDKVKEEPRTAVASDTAIMGGQLFDSLGQDAKFWKPVAIQAQQQGYANKVTGTNVFGHGREAANMIGQAVGGASDAIAAKTTGETRDALRCLVGGYREAASRSGTDEALTTFTPIHRGPGQDKLGTMRNPSKPRQLTMPWETQAYKARRVGQKNASRSSSVVPFTPPSAQRPRDGAGNSLAPVDTARAAGEASSSGKGKEAADESRLLVNQLRQQQGVDQAPPASPGPTRKKPRADGPQPLPQTPLPTGSKGDGSMGTDMARWQAALRSASEFWGSFEPRLIDQTGELDYEELLYQLRRVVRDEASRSRFTAFLQSDAEGWHCVERVVDPDSESAAGMDGGKCTIKRHRKAGECLQMRRVGGHKVEFQYMRFN